MSSHRATQPRQLCEPNHAQRLIPAVTTAVVLMLATASLQGGFAVASPFPNNKRSTVAFAISASSFSNGGNIPKKFTCDGTDQSPQLSWTDPPPRTKTLALLVDDPDAPIGNWNHWTLWNVPPTVRSLPEGMSKDANLPDGSQQGFNDFRKHGYNGPCPPPGKPHRYYFRLFALDVKLTLKENASKRELEAALKGHLLAQAEWMGRYARK